MSRYIFETKMEVRDYECDIEGIVNNANYLHYMEHTRHLFLKECGLSFAEMHNKGVDAVVASFTTLPVIGIPLNATALKGIDSLLAIVQMPSGMPVATMAVDGAKNAALFAVQIGAAFNKDLKEQYQQYRKDMAEKVLADNAELQGAIHI